MKNKSVSDLLWILAHFGSHISDSPYLLEHIVEERFEVAFVYRLVSHSMALRGHSHMASGLRGKGGSDRVLMKIALNLVLWCL